MEVTRKQVKGQSGAGACNYCQKQKISKDGRDLEYPYDTIIEVIGTHVNTRFCDECFQELIKKEVTTCENATPATTE